MHGFYPPTHGAKRLPGGLQPVPIHAFAKHHDIVLYAYKNCPRIKDMQHSVKQGYAPRPSFPACVHPRPSCSC